MKMLRYEIKKVFSKSKNRIAVIVLFVILVITSILTINKVEFVDENGNSSVGISASRDLREAKNQWAGYLTTDTLSNWKKTRQLTVRKRHCRMTLQSKIRHMQKSRA